MTISKSLVMLLGLMLLPLVSLPGEASKACLGCHDFGADSPVHSLLKGKHGDTDDGCASCHGASTTHQKRPTMASPDVSFGPRWSATVEVQDEQCLACHKDDTAQHWKESPHMAKNLTCVTCHDMHTSDDAVLRPNTQAQVCTVCHKVQKHGIHAVDDLLLENPACTACHNPHADQRPQGKMLANRSEGCRSCHDLVAMQEQSASSEKARSYHKVMVQKDRTCLDCHQGIAHGPAGAVKPVIASATASRTVTLFYPASSDVDWILGEHAGSQPFRQGSNCQQCHRGEEASMGAALGTAKPTSREVNVSFQREGEFLAINVSWRGEADDADIAMMWGDDGNETFGRGGCWAACHSDMPGMSRDRGLELGKYLGVSRQQQQRIGQLPIMKDDAALQALVREGNFVEMWHVKLEGGKADPATAMLLSKLDWLPDHKLQANAAFANGRWTVTLRRPLQSTPRQKSFVQGKRYTFGVAMHSAQRSGGQHWVSLPMTFSLDADDTDFRAD